MDILIWEGEASAEPEPLKKPPAAEAAGQQRRQAGLRRPSLTRGERVDRAPSASPQIGLWEVATRRDLVIEPDACASLTAGTPQQTTQPPPQRVGTTQPPTQPAFQRHLPQPTTRQRPAATPRPSTADEAVPLGPTAPSFRARRPTASGCSPVKTAQRVATVASGTPSWPKRRSWRCDSRCRREHHGMDESGRTNHAARNRLGFPDNTASGM